MWLSKHSALVRWDGVRTCVCCDIQSLVPSTIAVDAVTEDTLWGIYIERKRMNDVSKKAY